MARLTDRPAMAIAVDLGRKATKQTNKQTNKLPVLWLLTYFAQGHYYNASNETRHWDDFCCIAVS